MNKTCTQCKTDKPMESFYRNKSQCDGYSYQCKSCDADNNRLKRGKQRNDPKYIQLKKESAQRYYQKNKMKIRLKSNVDKWKREARKPLDYIRRGVTDIESSKCALMLGCSTQTAFDHLTNSGSLDLSDYHIDHIVPLSFIYKLGGIELVQASSSHISNLQLLPPKDNIRKSDGVYTQRQYEILSAWGYDLKVLT